MNYDIKTSCRIEELQEEHQLVICRLVNHLASQPTEYRNAAFKRLLNISQENPWTDDIEGFDKAKFLLNHPV